MLAQDCDLGTGAALDVGGGDVDRGVEGGAYHESRIVRVAAALLFLCRARGVVAQALHGQRGLGPDAAQHAAFLFEQRLACFADGDLVGGLDATAGGDAAFEPVLDEAGDHLFHVCAAHLNHRAELLAEELRQGVAVGREIDVETDVAGESHLECGDEQAAVRTVVVREDGSVGGQRANRGEEALEPGGVVEVGTHVTQLPVDLRQRRPTQSILAAAKVDEQKNGVASIGSQLRRERTAHVGDGREGADDERDRGGHAL